MNNEKILDVGEVMEYIEKMDSYIEIEFDELKEYANDKNFAECSACLKKIDKLRQEIINLKSLEVKIDE